MIKRKVCFVAVEQEGGFHFYPSRFIGYIANTRDKNMNNEYKDGKETNPAISIIIGKKSAKMPRWTWNISSIVKNLDLRHGKV